VKRGVPAALSVSPHPSVCTRLSVGTPRLSACTPRLSACTPRLSACTPRLSARAPPNSGQIPREAVPRAIIVYIEEKLYAACRFRVILAANVRNEELVPFARPAPPMKGRSA
jgi:hypothetical protein